MPQSKDTLSSPDVAYAAEQARAWYTLADAIVSPLKLGAGQDGYMKSWEVLKELVYDPRKQGALVPGDVLHSLLF